MTLSAHAQNAALAGIRALMIAIGIVAALLMNGLVFPRHCRVVFLSDTARTLGLLSQLYMTLGQCVLSVS